MGVYAPAKLVRILRVQSLLGLVPARIIIILVFFDLVFLVE